MSEATTNDSDRLRAHELLKRIVGITAMQPDQRCARINWLLQYEQSAYAAGRVAGLREAADICRARSVYYEQQEQKCGVDDSVRCIRGIQRNESAGCLEQIERAAQGGE